MCLARRRRPPGCKWRYGLESGCCVILDTDSMRVPDLMKVPVRGLGQHLSVLEMPR